MIRDDMKTNLFLLVLISLVVGTVNGIVLMTLMLSGFNKPPIIVLMLFLEFTLGFIGDKINKMLRKQIDERVRE